MATIEVDADGDEMAVERVGSPTEIAADTDEELEPKVEKRKRETWGREGGVLDAGGVAVPAESDDDELDSVRRRELSRLVAIQMIAS